MTPSEIQFTVPGVPKPQGSKRGFVVKGKAVLVESAGIPLKDWRAVVALAGTEKMAGKPPLDGPLLVDLVFSLPRPKSHPKTRITWPITRPDIDKLARSVLDALTHVCWVDDSQIVTLILHKQWAGSEIDLREPVASKQVGVTVYMHQMRTPT